LWGLEANYKCKACCGSTCTGGYRVNLFAGPRYLDLEESITISENFLTLPAAGVAFSAVTASDRFATHNQFYGGQLGVEAEYEWGPWSAEFKGKLALGDNHETVTIDGQQTLFYPNGDVSPGINRFGQPGGLLAESTNIGTHERDRLAFVPEVNIDLGYQLSSRLRGFVGYNILYASNVVRPGQQIDPVVSSPLIPNFLPANVVVPSNAPINRPVVPFHESDFWAQGLTVGLEFRY